MAMLTGVVKQVLSGDTLVLMGGPRPGGPPAVRTVCLAGIAAPRLAMKSQTLETRDEPFAFASREAIRKKVIGEVVSFHIEAKDRDRELATVTFDGRDLAVDLVAQGLAKVRSGPVNIIRQLPNIAALQEAEIAARDKKMNLWSDDQSELQDSVRHINWLQGDNEGSKLFAKVNDKKVLNGVVEFVRDGGCLRLYLPNQETVATVMLSGVQVDRWRRVEGYPEPSPEPFAEEGRYFTEVRLLNRDVKLRVEGCDDFGNVIGSVYHPKGNIALLLLRNGFAKVHEGSVRGTGESAAYREAQHDAQKNQVRRWRGYIPSEGPSKLTGKVIEVVSGDCVVVLCEDPQTGQLEEKRLYIASVRAPRNATRQRSAEPWSAEVKEWARKLLIGREVIISVQYQRDAVAPPGGNPPPASDSSGKLLFCSLQIVKKGSTEPVGEDYGLQGVKKGYLRLAPHRSDDPRAENFDALVEAEKEAAAASRNIHGRPAPVTPLNDLLGPANLNKAKGWEPTFLRAGEMEGYIDHVFNGNRFKLVVPSNNVALSFILGGIRAPQMGRTQGGQLIRHADPFAEEAVSYIRENWLQRDVKFNVDVCDRGGNFIGVIHKGNQCCNIALVKAGLATVNEVPLPPPSIRQELINAQTEAQEKRLGIWSDASAFVEAEDDKAIDPLLGKTFDNIAVTFCRDVTEFFVQHRPPSEVEGLQNSIAEWVGSLSDTDRQLKQSFSSLQPPKPGETVLARFSEDNQFYRAKVTHIDKVTKEILVTYTDFGNSEIRPVKELLKCPEKFAKGEPLGVFCHLFGVLAPLGIEEEGADAFQVLADSATKVQFVGSTKGTNKQDARKRHSAVLMQQDGTEINKLMLEQGLGIATPDAPEDYKIAEKVARSARLYVWRHGDVGLYDEPL